MTSQRLDPFQVIADPGRRKMLMMLSKNSLTINSIAENFEMSRPAISQHIKILTECGIIVIKKQGRERHCELQAERLASVADWIEPFRKMWEERFDRMDQLINELKHKKQKK